MLIIHGTGSNWLNHDHFRVVFLRNMKDMTEAIGRIERFLSRMREEGSVPSSPPRGSPVAARASRSLRHARRRSS